MRRRWPVALKATAKLIGRIPIAGSAIAVAVGLALAAPGRPGEGLPTPAIRVVEVVIPLVFGLQSAFLLSPDGDPAIELLLASPRPMAWALGERLLVWMASLGGLALVGTLIEGSMDGSSGLVRVAAWLVPSLSIGGAALFTTQLTRQGTFGALLATLLWGGMLFGFDAVLTRWPFLWPWHIYLRPGPVAARLYIINRAVWCLASFGFVALAVHLLNDDERVLGLRGAR